MIVYKEWAGLVSPVAFRSCVCHPADKQIQITGDRQATDRRPTPTCSEATDRVQLADQHAVRHLSGVGGVADIFEAFCGVPARLLPQHLLSSGVLVGKTNAT